MQTEFHSVSLRVLRKRSVLKKRLHPLQIMHDVPMRQPIMHYEL